MDFSLTPAQTELRDRVVSFAEEMLNEETLSDDVEGRFPLEKWRACGEFGILGLNVPESYGGGGHDILTTLIALEGLGYGCRENGLPFAITSQMWSVQPAILKFGTEEQKKRYLPALCAGTSIGAFGISEAETGSDTYAMKTRAVKTDGGYVINGRKSYITSAPVCDLAIVFAVTSPEEGRWGISGFVIEADTRGFSRSPVRDKMGLRTTQMGDLILDDCFVPESCLLGAEGAGVSIFSTAMESERGYIFAAQLGRQARQLEQAIQYAKDREAFDQPIGRFQSVANRIADMKLRLETARLLLYHLAWLEQTGQPLALHASLANLHLSETFVDSSLDAIRTFGAKGYVSEFEIERDLRDAVGGLIYSGTSDIQRVIIARLLGL